LDSPLVIVSLLLKIHRNISTETLQDQKLSGDEETHYEEVCL